MGDQVQRTMGRKRSGSYSSLLIALLAGSTLVCLVTLLPGSDAAGPGIRTTGGFKSVGGGAADFDASRVMQIGGFNLRLRGGGGGQSGLAPKYKSNTHLKREEVCELPRPSSVLSSPIPNATNLALMSPIAMLFARPSRVQCHGLRALGTCDALALRPSGVRRLGMGCDVGDGDVSKSLALPLAHACHAHRSTLLPTARSSAV